MKTPIVVAGSLNMDFVAQVEHLPLPGETILGSGFRTIPGGKGANQACAAGRLGGDVRMVGRVGPDVFGQQLRESLAQDHVNVDAVAVSHGVASGVALILVAATGQNQIVVASGANGTVVPSDIEPVLDQARGGYLLLQLETPMETVTAAAAAARGRGVTVVLDPAPAQPLPAALLASVDILTPNETEANILLGRAGGSVSVDDAPELAAALRARGVGTVILKLGEKGAFLLSATEQGHFPAPSVQPADTTAAGDTFNGALAVALSEGRSLADAIRFANVAAALSVTRMGAQSSIPSRTDVDSFPS